MSHSRNHLTTVIADRLPYGLRARGWFIIFATVLLALLFVFARTLLQSPTRTPLLVVSTFYDPPWELNPGSSENIRALENLDRHNLTVRTLADPDALSHGQWSEFEDSIAQLDHAAARGKPLLIYINLHGAVDQNLRPCFLFRHSEALEPSSWLPLQSLIDHIGNVVKKERSVVLFLESGRQAGPLPSELPDNLFAVGVRKLVESYTASSKLNRLSVLVSTTANLASTDPCDGKSDPFTRYLSEALAGVCDQRSHGGNGNHLVELGELDRYVHENTRLFAMRERGFTQTTMMSTSDNEATGIAWANSSTNQSAPLLAHAATSQSVSEIEMAWRSIDSLSKMEPWRDRPAQWAELNQLAIALEVFGFGGPERTTKMTELKQRFQALESSLAIENNKNETPIDVKDLDLQIAENEFQVWNSIADAPTIQKAIELVAAQNLSAKAAAVKTVPFLWQAAKQPELWLWRSPDSLKIFAEASRRFALVRQQSCMIPELKHVAERQSLLDRERRQIEDQLLANVLNESIKNDIRRFSTSVEALERWTSWFLTALRSHNKALADIPILYRACDVVDAVQRPVNAALSTQVEKIANGLANNIQVLRNESSKDDVLQSFVDVTSELALLKQELAIRWRDLVAAPDAMSPRKIFAVQELLRSGFLPNAGESLEKGIQLRLASRKLLSRVSVYHSTSEKSKREPTPSSDLLELSHRSQIAVAGLITEAAEQTIASKQTEQNREVQSTEMLMAIASEAMQHDAVSGSPEDHTVAMSIARIVSSLCLDDESSQIVMDWNSMQTKRRLVRCSYRVMEDFWNEPLVRSEPFFVAVSKELLGEASKDGSDALSLQFSEAYQLLASRKDAAVNGLQLLANGIPSWRLDSEEIVGCEIKQGLSVNAMPTGTASIRLQYKNNIADSGAYEAIGVGPAMQTQRVSLNLPKSMTSQSDRSSSLIASLRFRGHKFDSDCEYVSNLKNISVSNIAKQGFATVSIQDQRAKRRARTLILDCSASMIDRHYLEGTASTGENRSQTVVDSSKLMAARLAMTDILNRWRETNDLIGVVLFGHRVAVGNASQGNLLQNRYYAKFPFPQSLRAFEDVETILPVGRFGDAEYSAVMNRLDALLPWGQTPLYLALQQAIEQTTNIGNGISHDVIVVSDGRNYQFNPAPEKNISIETVIQQAKQLGVRIHVIGFGVPEAELQEATLQYRRLADETGGTATMQVANAVELVSNLDKLVQPDTYSVRLATGESWQSPCNQPITIPLSIPVNTPAWIAYRNQQRLVPLSPRSAIRLNLATDERLVCAEYTDAGEASRTPILNANSTPSQFLLGTYQPRVQESGLLWHLSLQRIDGEVAQRPKYLWVEIDPATSNESSSNANQDDCYYLSEAAWTPDTPIPVLQFQTKGWPEEAKTGQVRFWCTDVVPKSLGEIEVKPASLVGESKKSSQVTGSLPNTDVRYQVHVEKDGIVLVFIHQSDAVRPSSLVPVLELNGDSMQVERQYRNLQRMSIHRFLFPPRTQQVDKAMAPQSLRFQVLDSNDIKRNGLQLSSPADVFIRANIAAMPSSAPPVLRR